MNVYKYNFIHNDDIKNVQAVGKYKNKWYYINWVETDSLDTFRFKARPAEECEIESYLNNGEADGVISYSDKLPKHVEEEFQKYLVHEVFHL